MYVQFLGQYMHAGKRVAAYIKKTENFAQRLKSISCYNQLQVVLLAGIVTMRYNAMSTDTGYNSLLVFEAATPVWIYIYILIDRYIT